MDDAAWVEDGDANPLAAVTLRAWYGVCMLTFTLSLLLACRVERCDGVDNDADGLVDDADPDVSGLKWHEDLDGDTFGDPATGRRQCRQPGGYVADGTDCDDGDAAVRPDAAEVCDGIDDDCDGLVDDADPDVDETGMERWYADADGDGSGDCTAVYACAQPAGTVPGNTVVWCDCDDTNPDIHSSADEVCDGIDNDCDALVDGDDDDLSAQAWYPDRDYDGYGSESHYVATCDPPEEAVTTTGDCDDADPAVHPGAAEVCDDIDDDCNGLVDGQDPYLTGAPTWYADDDADGYGDASSADIACHAPRGTVADGTDCDDADASRNPGELEVCDDIDDDCDGLTDGQDDSLIDGNAYYLDIDGDGFGDPATVEVACDWLDGYVSGATDCDDGDAAVYPGAGETCDSVDNDCDGLVDDDDPDTALTTFYADTDGDSYGDLASPASACSAPAGYVANALDCDDTDATSGSCGYPADCVDALVVDPGALSGPFLIDPDGDGVPVDVGCDMDTDGGGWTILADDDYASDACPAEWTLDATEGLCAGAYLRGGVESATWSALGVTWSEVQVRVVARQYSSLDAYSCAISDIEQHYMDGVSVTHGSPGAREHIWSYAMGRDSGSGAPEECPDQGGYSAPSFVGADGSCATGNPWTSWGHGTWYRDELFDELEQVALSGATTDDVEVRILADQPTSDEDVGITRVYIAVR